MVNNLIVIRYLCVLLISAGVQFVLLFLQAVFSEQVDAHIVSVYSQVKRT